MVARLLDIMLIERVGDKAVEMCNLSAFISWLSHLARTGQAPGHGAVRASLRYCRVLENSPSASRSVFILQFSPVINSLMHGHVRAMRNILQEL